MSIYLVEQGEYSSRHVVGYCTSKKAAEKYCAGHNRMKDAEWHNEHFVTVCRNLEKLMTHDVPVRYMYNLRMCNNGDLNDFFTRSVEVRFEPGIKKIEGNTIWVVVEKRDINLAIKVAKDYLMHKKAEEQGL